MPDSGIPWDYAYQYLTGGVNTNSGWETWNSDGQFALSYARSAGAHGYLPVFSYYELQASSGSCSGCGEIQKDLSNLNNPATMAAYYQNFARLMQQLGPSVYGKPAIVHVEPDLSGFAQQAVANTTGCYGYCSGQGADPSYLKASVASSGYGPVAGLPNTYTGFNWALLHLRDLYAPNVLLAVHVSDWATGVDISSDARSGVDASGLGQQAGSFAARSGITGVPNGSSTYDLIFNDVSDRDAGYYKSVLGNASVWWDRLNNGFPNFHRWESYVSAVSSAAGRSVMVWQIPEGNQYFDSENNTTGHYQDNRAEYFFGHIDELAQSNVIGLLFGSGHGGSTVHFDGMKDGVTNPAALCTSDGLSSGQICASHLSSTADDDGGYIRMAAQRYYASGPHQLGTQPTPTPTVVSTTTPQPTSTAAPSPPPSSGLAAVSPLSLSSSAVYAGGKLSGSATLQNSSSSSVSVSQIEIAARPPVGSHAGGPYDDFGGLGSVSLAPGQSVTIQETRSFTSADPLGQWYAYLTYELSDGSWHDASPDLAFSVLPNPGFSQSTSASPAQLPAGAQTAIQAALTVNSGSLADGIVDVEVYSAAGQKVGQQFFSGQSISAGQTRPYSVSWTAVPAIGIYRVTVGVFGSGWSPALYWVSDAASVRVV